MSESACNDPLEAVTPDDSARVTDHPHHGSPAELGHTGSNVAAQAAVALLLLVVGAQLVVGTLRRREGHDCLSW